MPRLLVGILLISTFCSALPRHASAQADGTEVWTQLFNGKDLEGWTPKIRYYDYGDNYADTFRVVDGLLTVSYDKYDGPFNERFGHLYWKETYSHYVLRAEYRFIGEQVKGGPGWALRNSGFMVHGQDPKGIEKDQEFPVSIEVQLLGGDGTKPRTTGNLCTPGTHVVYKDKLHTPHCTNSSSPTFHGDQWVTVEIEVHGNKLIKHKINGEVVLEYTEPQLDPKDKYAAKLIAAGAPIPVEGGTISVQSESHPVQFRKIEIRKLTP